MGVHMRFGTFLTCVFCSLIAGVFAASAHAGGITLSPQAVQALDQTYSGDPDAAIATSRAIEQAQPESPVGYLLEDEAEWWKIYCAACEIKWGQLDAWKRAKKPEDDAYFALADKAIALARAQLERSDTAEMHLYAGLGFGLKARLYSLREERHNIARAGVASRAEFPRPHAAGIAYNHLRSAGGRPLPRKGKRKVRAPLNHGGG